MLVGVEDFIFYFTYETHGKVFKKIIWAQLKCEIYKESTVPTKEIG